MDVKEELFTETKKQLEYANYLVSKYGLKNAVILSAATKLSVVFLTGLGIILICWILFEVIG